MRVLRFMALVVGAFERNAMRVKIKSFSGFVSISEECSALKHCEDPDHREELRQMLSGTGLAQISLT